MKGAKTCQPLCWVRDREDSAVRRLFEIVQITSEGAHCRLLMAAGEPAEQDFAGFVIPLTDLASDAGLYEFVGGS